MTQVRTTRKVLGAASVIGDQLVSSDGDEIGMIHELLIDPEVGEVTFAVVSFDRLPSLGGSLYVIPWRTLRAVPEEHHFVFDLTQAHTLGAFVPDSEAAINDDEWRWASNGCETLGYKRDVN
jgi:sporulation protein YlmC with PRC-barrel domain